MLKNNKKIEKKFDYLVVKTICSNIRNLPSDILYNSTIITNISAYEGDIVVAEVMNENGSIVTLENQEGRDVKLYKNDIILVVLGNRFSSTSEYGSIGEKIYLKDDMILDLLSNGGIVGIGQSIPKYKISDSFTRLKILGAICYKDKIVNIKHLIKFSLNDNFEKMVPIIFIGGTSAEVGKTTISKFMIRAFKRKNLKIGCVKLTGSGRFRDILSMKDAGADFYMDFADFGLASTYTNSKKAVRTSEDMLKYMSNLKPDVIIAELGGDIIEANIPAILKSEIIKNSVYMSLHAANDVIGILGSKQIYKKMHANFPVYYAFPKDRNKLGTIKRLERFNVKIFDPYSEIETNKIATKIIQEIKNRRTNEF